FNTIFTPCLSHVDAEFFRAVTPGTKVKIKSNKHYQRNNILRSRIEMHDDSETGNLIARISGLCNFQILDEKIKYEKKSRCNNRDGHCFPNRQ
ncbi:MAG: hypothetical protein R6V32_06645, partial [Bacteroidales bacterium]